MGYWADMSERMGKIRRAVDATPPPPVPDDSWSEVRAGLNTALERAEVMASDRALQEVDSDDDE